MVSVSVPGKACTGCGLWQPLSEYFHHRGKSSGYDGRCKTCCRRFRAPRKYKPGPGRWPLPYPQRFWAKVRKTDGCWLWEGGRDKNGYGTTFIEGKFWKAHRAAYVLLIGPIPDGHVLDHLCENPSCVRPDHLQPVKQAENVRRWAAKHHPKHELTGCKRGHPFSPENTRYTKSGHRQCHACRRERQAERKALTRV